MVKVNNPALLVELMNSFSMPGLPALPHGGVEEGPQKKMSPARWRVPGGSVCLKNVGSPGIPVVDHKES